MLEKVKDLLHEVENFTPKSEKEVEEFRLDFLGKKGCLSELFAAFKDAPNESKKAFGKAKMHLGRPKSLFERRKGILDRQKGILERQKGICGRQKNIWERQKCIWVPQIYKHLIVKTLTFCQLSQLKR